MHWQPNETAPRDGNAFLAWPYRSTSGENDVVIAFFMNGDFYAEDVFAERFLPSHWMPLPQAPENTL